MRLLYLEGNIASGKSTICRLLGAHTDFAVAQEPVEAWQESFPTNVLQEFYESPRQFAPLFHIVTLITRLELIDSFMDSVDVLICERSINVDRFVFVELAYKSGLITESEYLAYCRLWNWIHKHAPTPRAFLYLRTSANLCFERLRLRNRAEEQSITIEYLLELEKAHDNWLNSEENVFVLDGNKTWKGADIAKAIKAILSELRLRE